MLTELFDLVRNNFNDFVAWQVLADKLLDEGDVRGKLIQLHQQRFNGKLSQDEREAIHTEIKLIESELGLHRLGRKINTQLSTRYSFVTEVQTSSLEQVLSFLPQLAKHPLGVFLHRLDLSGNSLCGEEVRNLVQAEYFSKVTHLDLNCNGIEEAGAHAIAYSENSRNLTNLVLAGNALRDNAIRALAASPYLSCLTHLDLSRNQIRREEIQALADSKAFPNLKTLNLRNNFIGAEGKKILKRAATLGGIDYIYF